MTHFKVFLYLFIFLSYYSAEAQKIDTFSVQPKILLENLETHMLVYKKPIIKETLDDFGKMLKSKPFEGTEAKEFTHVLNQFVKLKLNVSTYFRPYISAYVAHRLKLSSEQVSIWLNMINQIVEQTENKNNNTLKSFLKFSEGFIKEKALKKNVGGTYWSFTGDKFKYDIKDKKPKIILENVDLLTFRNEDTVRIYKTSGYIDIEENIWYGQKGKIDWTVVGLDPKIYCTLGDYEINFKKGKYTANDVSFYYPEYFGSKAIKGVLTNRFESGKNKEKNNPSFESYDKIIMIDNFAELVKFKGGFKLKGNKIYGFGTKKEPAEIEISLDAKKKFHAKSPLFTLKKETNQILSKASDIEIYLKEGKISHPSAALRYDIKDKKLKISRGSRGRNGNPFIDDYHKVDITVNDLTYYIAKDSIIIGEKILGLSRSNDKAIFRSVDYFSEDIFDRFQNISDNNPVVLLKLFCEREGTNYINASEYAQMFNTKNTSKSITSLLYDMVEKGFILYDDEIDSIQVFDKVKLYSDASRGNVDYDLIQLNSVATNSNNGYLVLDKQDITINDIGNFKFSKKKKVGGKPYGKKIVLQKNRNLLFDGSLFAGKAVIEGYRHQFNYDKFKIHTDSVNFINFYLPSDMVDKKGRTKYLSIGSKIENTEATLLIDAPNNKSGKENISIFPTLKTTEKSYVFYDKGIHNGSYQRDSFYFELDPFILNNLKKLQDVQMAFKGELYSFDIFPRFKETVTLQGKEKILGFESETPKEGYALYKDKGDFTGNVKLNKDGLTGVGDVNFLNAHFYAEGIQFLLDSLQANSQKFDIKERRTPTPEIPFAEGLDVTIDWIPYKDSMYVRSKEKPFNILAGGDKTLDGLLILTSEGVKGKGLFEWSEGQLSSKLMSFDANKVYADTASMKINAFEKEDFAFDTRNVNGTLNFDKKEGHFRANDDKANTTLPYNKYITSMNAFDWDMKKSLITFKSKENTLGAFTSIHKDQDSLFFEGKHALYDLKSNILEVDGVPFLRCADAFIYPDSFKVTIEPNAKMTTLKNAVIKADTLSQYHVIKKADIDVLGLKSYSGSGYYTYDVGKKKQEIFFDNIVGSRVGKGKRAEKKTETRGDGIVEEKENFYMDYRTKFKGDIQLKSSFKNLYFNGFGQIDAHHLPYKEWFRCIGRIDKDRPIIKYSKPKNEEGDILYTGFYLSKDFDAIYPSIMSTNSFVKDRHILDIDGIFVYDKPTDSYIFGDSTKVLNNTVGGNVLTFSNLKSNVEATGKLNFCEFLEDVSVNTAGLLKTNIPLDSIDYDNYTINAKVATALDFYVPKPLMEIVLRDFNANLFDAKNIKPQLNLKLYKDALCNLFPDPKLQEQIQNQLDRNFIDIPPKSNKYSILFGLMDMKWDSDFQAFISTKKKNDLISIGGNKVNKQIESYVEFKMPYDNKDRFYVYIKSTTGNYYYFVYKDHILSTVSNNVRYNDAVHDLGKKERRKKVKGDYIEVEAINQGSASSFKEAILEAMGQ